MTPLVTGADFYSGPTVSADGSRIAWVEWMHPNMVWPAERAATIITGWPLTRTHTPARPPSRRPSSHGTTRRSRSRSCNRTAWRWCPARSASSRAVRRWTLAERGAPVGEGGGDTRTDERARTVGRATHAAAPGVNANESVVHPVWERSGNLLFISDRTDWWSLYRATWPGLAATPIFARATEVCDPHWVFARPPMTYVDAAETRLACTAR